MLPHCHSVSRPCVWLFFLFDVEAPEVAIVVEGCLVQGGEFAAWRKENEVPTEQEKLSSTGRTPHHRMRTTRSRARRAHRFSSFILLKYIPEHIIVDLTKNCRAKKNVLLFGPH
ncbi:hypothetical protein BDQ17DRAFT_1371875 [Cyathus striatus]|nr:hypothetical protein BDQ17DRAFT_1371875 [Cyathus striatus]